MSNSRSPGAADWRAARARRRLGVPLLWPVLAGLGVVIGAPVGVTFAAEGDGYRIEAVTLSSGGLAEIRRSISLEEAAALGFDVPLDQVDDILKSLLVYDPAGGVAAITLDGPSQVEETFRGLPFTPDDLRALPRLLDTLQGVPVRVSSSGRTVEGMVLGVDIAAPLESEGEEPAPLLSILTEQGQLVTIRLRADAQLDILDPAVRESLRQAVLVSGQGRVAGMRSIKIGLDGSGPREVRLDYVVPAPVWKTAYRLILDAEGTARLQAWAIIENASGDDWSDVELTLSSGAPVTLAQRLYQRYWHQRPEVPVFAQTIAAPAPDRYRETEAEQAFYSGAEMVTADAMRLGSASLPASAPISPSAPVAVAEAVDGANAATYLLPMPVDLASGETMSVPFIDAQLTAERISLFQPERGEVHPIATLRLENTTGSSLPPGLVTVYAPQEEGYAGDAQLANVPPGESRMISFAADRKVEVTTEYGDSQTIYRATLADGVLRVTGITRTDTSYAITGAQDAPRTVVIEHPRQAGWTLSSDALESTTPTSYRLQAKLAAGGTAKVVASVERTDLESIALVDSDADTLLYWLGQLDDPATKAILSELAKSRQDIARAENTLASLEQDLGEASDGQARIRENLAAVPAESALAGRYLDMLGAEEDRIADIETRRGDAEQALEALTQAFSEKVSAL
ncbi:DUF4139 domain-containing protein [Devosia sp. ZW T5_3]|uniref:DUF4139 domain-containing protein n=1 Tax=Devosia sp. ZW T5_3 TaxID=3378085 RepID=UPI003854FFCE